MEWTLTALQIVLVLAAYELVRFVVVRRFQAALRAGAVQFVRRHRIRLESARFIDRVWIREALAQDPRIETVLARLARETDRSLVELRGKVDAYVEEIAPFFSLAAYYRLGSVVARRIIDFLFELVVERGGFEAQVAQVPTDAVRVYVINHRANMDPLVLAYGLLRHVPMSYAVGEWALVWPLHTLFRSFGSYFVRRGEPDPLYHAVLERFRPAAGRAGRGHRVLHRGGPVPGRGAAAAPDRPARLHHRAAARSSRAGDRVHAGGAELRSGVRGSDLDPGPTAAVAGRAPREPDLGRVHPPAAGDRQPVPGRDPLSPQVRLRGDRVRRAPVALGVARGR